MSKCLLVSLFMISFYLLYSTHDFCISMCDLFVCISMYDFFFFFHFLYWRHVLVANGKVE